MRLGLVFALVLCCGMPSVAAAADLGEAPPAKADSGDAAAADRAAMGALAMAKHLYKQGKYKKAAAFFRQAYDVKPIPEFLFNAARAEQRGYLLREAERDFLVLLARPNLDATMRRRAKIHLKEVREALAHTTRLKAEAADARAQASRARANAKQATMDARMRKNAEKSGQWTNRLKWPVLGIGVAALGFGTWSLLNAAASQSDLDTHIDPDTGKFRPTITVAEARSQQSSINGGYFTGWVSAGLGAALLGVGTWLLSSESDSSIHQTRSTLAITPMFGRRRGMAIAWQF